MQVRSLGQEDLLEECIYKCLFSFDLCFDPGVIWE